MTRELQPDVIAKVADLPAPAGPFNSHLSLGYMPVAGHIVYSLDPNGSSSTTAGRRPRAPTCSSRGAPRSASARSIPFHVTSLDWQESDRVLAGIMTTFGAPTGAVPIDGNGEFDGLMLASFSKPRIEGTFKGDRLRAWDVVWGQGDRRRRDREQLRDRLERDHDVRASRRFAPTASFPSAIRARTRERRSTRASGSIAGRSPDLRHAFQLDDYPMEGLVSGDFHLYGPYERPFGFGNMAIDRASRTARRSSARPRRCASRATACGSTRWRSRRAAARSPAPRSSAGRATTPSTRTARGFRSSR